MDDNFELLEEESLIQYDSPVEGYPVIKIENNDNNKIDLETILNIMIPPKEWQKDNKNWTQYVLKKPASREDVANLQNWLDEKLESMQARKHGICPIREKLYSQCFDEIIRQVAVNSPERGLLLMKVRDELKMTLAAYLTLYKSSIIFYMKKENESLKEIEDLKKKENDCNKKLENLKDQKEALLIKKSAMIKKINESAIIRKNQKERQLKNIKFQNLHLDTFFKNNSLK